MPILSKKTTKKKMLLKKSKLFFSNQKQKENNFEDIKKETKIKPEINKENKRNPDGCWCKKCKT